MVIQSNMSPEAIVEVWDVTAAVFQKYKIPHSKEPLKTLVKKEQLNSLLQELNSAVRSSSTTCIEGG
ncbi:hypothetical protein ABN702_15695 [Bacillus haimaensis]|uniref:hypothetical protein n=1 Tax=Bacillus haimaensis TaxID=3160967 RepID=UPI003AA9D9FC